MRFTQHPSNNFVLRAPPGVPIEECKALPVTRVVYEDMTPGMRSYWKPSEDDLKKLNTGSVICLEVLGDSHPMVIVAVADKEGSPISV